MNKLIDTHVHLDKIANIEQAIAEARSANIIAIIGVGSDLESNQKILALAEQYQGYIYPSLGYHPYNIKVSEVDHTLEFMEANINQAVAIGEIGLDYHKRVREKADKDLQKRVLQEVLQLARKYDKPALVHSRYAWRDSLDLVESVPVARAVFHWYAGTSSVLRDIVRHGYFISATPAVEYHAEHRRAIKEIPLERLLLETDAPVVYHRESEMEYESRPVHLLRTLAGAAAIKGLDIAQVAEATTENAIEFFRLPLSQV